MLIRLLSKPHLLVKMRLFLLFVINSFFFFSSESQLFALTRITPITTASESPFDSLPINDKEKRLIYKIITTMADKNPIQLAFEKKSLEKKGQKIHHVHPFRFLGYVFSEPILKDSMYKIRKSHFKWNGFIDGYAKKMSSEAARDNLLPYVQGFAQFLHVSPTMVSRYIQKRDYEGLVRFLL